VLQFAREQCVKAVVITPTRELCNQAAKNIAVCWSHSIYLWCYVVQMFKHFVI